MRMRRSSWAKGLCQVIRREGSTARRTKHIKRDRKNTGKRKKPGGSNIRKIKSGCNEWTWCKVEAEDIVWRNN